MTGTKFLLLLGPSGAGKSSIIWKLRKLDARYTYISPYTNRPLRPGEQDKVSVSDAEIDRLESAGQLLVVNPVFGWRYATPRFTIDEALAADRFPVLDWPVNRIDVMQQAYADKLFAVYVAPPSLEALNKRLGYDGRDPAGIRYSEATRELASFQAGEFASLYHLEVVTHDGGIEVLAQQIHAAYTSSFA